MNQRKVPDPEVPPVAKRRKFSASYKLEILERVEACSEPGEVGKLLRQEGLFSSHLSMWRMQRDAGALSGLSTKRGRKAKPAAEKQSRHEIRQLKRENERLLKKLRQAETIISVQKKLSSLLGLDEPEETS